MIDLIAKEAGKILNCDEESVKRCISRPEKKSTGDYSLECFKLRNWLEETPDRIAVKLSQQLNLPEFSEIKAVGSYLNFYLSKEERINRMEKWIKAVNEIHFINIGNILDNELDLNSAYDLIISYQIINLFKLLDNDKRELIYHTNRESSKNNGKITGEKIEGKYYKLLSELNEKNLLNEINGVKAVLLKEDNLPPLILDLSRDIYVDNIKLLAELIYKIERSRQDKYIYSFKKNDSLKVQQLINVCKKAGYEAENNITYISLGNIRLADGPQKDKWITEAALSTKTYIDERKLILTDDEIEKVLSLNIIIDFLKESKGNDKCISWENEGAEIYCIYKNAQKVMQENEGYNYLLEFQGNSFSCEEELLSEVEEYKNSAISSVEGIEPYFLACYLKSISLKLKKYLASNENTFDRELIKIACEAIDSIFYILGVNNY